MGMKAENLVPKVVEDFQNPGEHIEIAQIRFNHYNNKLKGKKLAEFDLLFS